MQESQDKKEKRKAFLKKIGIAAAAVSAGGGFAYSHFRNKKENSFPKELFLSKDEIRPEQPFLQNNTPKTYVIDLDSDPRIRWNEMIDDHKVSILDVIKDSDSMFGNSFISWILTRVTGGFAKICGVMYYDELVGISEKLGIPLGKIILLQLAYEFSTCCTSIVTEQLDDDGKKKIAHYRTMDWDLIKLKPITINVVFTKNNKIVCRGTTWPAYVGLLTGINNNYSISINYRITNNSGLLSNAYNALTSSWPVSFLIREILLDDKTYEDAKKYLENASLIAPVYIIMSSKENGCVITRERGKAVKTLELKSSTQEKKFLIQTNRDHWRKKDDDQWQDIENSIERTSFAEKTLNEYHRNNANTKTNMWKLMRAYPVNKENTIYVTGMCLQDEYYETFF